VINYAKNYSNYRTGVLDVNYVLFYYGHII